MKLITRLKIAITKLGLIKKILAFITITSLLTGIFFGLRSCIAGATKANQEKILENLKNDSLSPTPETIRQLGNFSIWINDGGNRQSYQTLLSWEKDKTIDFNLKRLITSEIKRVQETYYTYPMRRAIDNENGRWLRWGWICKVKPNPEAQICADGIEPPKGFNAANVLAHLYKTDPETPWQEYARAACILRNIRTAYNKDSLDNKRFFGRLIAFMGENERSLCVSKMAFETYKELANFSLDEVLNFEEAFGRAIEDWENPERKEEILKINF